MKKLPLIILIMMMACKQEENSTKKKQLDTAVTVQRTGNCNYVQTKTHCKILLQQYRNQATCSTEANLVAYIADSLFSCWYGTPWDYNGCTSKPGEGKIACGYFVTTVLQDAGVHINRIKMAQCASSELIRNSCTGVKKHSNKTVLDFVEKVKEDGKGLYITGLDFHTGFIYNDGKEVYFIHSTYYGSRCVVKEPALSSWALKNTKLRMIGKVNFMQ